MRNKTAYQVYSQGSQHGEFGSGDHKSEGGKVVAGVNGPIHIQGGIENDIMKTHGKQGEYILAQSKGYKSISEAPINKITGYPQYGLFDRVKDAYNKGKSMVSNAYDFYDSAHGGVLPGGVDPMSGKETQDWWDKTFSDPLQETFGIGQYSEESKRNEQLKDLLGSQIGDVLSGSKKMLGQGGFIEKEKAQTMQKLDMKTDVVREGMDAGKVENLQTKSNLIGQYGMEESSLEKMETQGTSAIENIGIDRDAARNKSEMDKFNYQQRTQSALTTMLSDYMSTTGETIDQGYIDLLTDYMDDPNVEVEDYI